MASGISVSKVAQEITLHFAGGLRGRAFADQSVQIGPLRNPQSGDMIALHIRDFSNNPLAFLNQLGLTWIGTEESPRLPSPRTRIWYPFNYGRLNLSGFQCSSDYWGGIKTSLGEAGDHKGEALARKIAFQARASALRLRDISDEYHKQLQFSFHDSKRNARRFTNIETESLYLSLHSFLYEICALRDYLASFAHKYVFKQESEIQYFSSLVKKLRENAIEHELADVMLAAANDKLDPGWLFRLSSLRNQIAHGAPIHHGTNAGWVNIIKREVKSLEVRSVSCHISDFQAAPIPEVAPVLADALDTFFSFYLEMESFSALVAKSSEIEPKIQGVRPLAFDAEAHRQSGAAVSSAQEQDDQAFIDSISDFGAEAWDPAG